MTSVPPAQPPAAPETDASGWLAALTEAHRDSYPMGNIHHGTPENPDWGTFCVECKESWPCDVSRLLERVRVVEGERDDIADRLSTLLCDLTGGRMSKTGYSVSTMIQAVEAEFEKHATEDTAALVAEHQWNALERAREADFADARAESAEAAHAAMVKVLGEYFDFDVDPWDDHDAACPAPEDVWRLHRDLRALLAGGAS